MYPNVSLLIDGQWTPAAAGRTLTVVNPGHRRAVGTVAHADRADLDRALEAAEKGFHTWRKVSAFDRSKVMRKAADLLRARADDIARIMTMEQGKPLAEAKGETLAGADVIDWFAEEARRTYGRVVPARAEGVYQLVIKEPVGPVAAFTPWNFPINQVVRKLSRGAGRRLLHHRQGAGGNAGLSGRTDPLLRRCRRAGRRGEPGLWRAGGDFRIPHPASDHPQDVVHRLDRGRQAAGRAGRRAHEARDDGAGRPRAGDRVRRRRRRRRQPASWRRASSAMPARSASRRRASWCRRRCTTSSSSNSSATRRR